MSELGQSAYILLNKINQIERKYKTELEQLAIKIVSEEFNLNEGDLIIDVKLNPKPTSVSEIEIKPKKLPKLSNLDLEVQKRHLINALIQGAAIKTGYAYHLVNNELKKIHPELVNMYSLISVMTESGYFAFPDEIIDQHGSVTGVGKVKVNIEKEVPEIKVEASTFPFLIHELVKGVMEVLTSHDQHLTPEEREYVLSQTDKRTFESMALRLGPKFWEKFNDAIYEAKLDKYRNNIIAYLSHLKPNEFNTIMKDIFKGDINSLKKIGKEIEDTWT